MKKKLYLGIFIICLLSFCNRAQARAFEVDGIYYSAIGAEGDITVEVVSPEKGGPMRATSPYLLRFNMAVKHTGLQRLAMERSRSATI